MISVVGTAAVAGDTLALPAHQAGDMIVLAAQRTAASQATRPNPSGTVPDWNSISLISATGLTLETFTYVATASNTTSGQWLNATNLTAIVLRTDNPKATLKYTRAAGGNASTQTIVYPALTNTYADGTSIGIRHGTRLVASAAVGTPPTNWTNRITHPAGANAIMAVHTRANLPANPASDSVSTPGTAAQYRSNTIEIVEALVPDYETMIDDFTRAAPEKLDVSGKWVCTWYNSSDPTDLRSISGLLLGSVVANYQSATTVQKIDNSSGNCDVVIDCNAAPVAPNYEFGMYVLMTNPGTPNFSCYAVFCTQTNFILRRYANGVNMGNLANVAATIAPYGKIWFRKRGSLIQVYRLPYPATQWTRVISVTDANHNPTDGVIAVEISDTSQRWDNLRGGPLVIPSVSKIVSVV